jgi:hypothetical protein
MTGADLLGTTVQNAERAQRLNAREPGVKPVESLGDKQSSLDEDTQGALLRFARFINKEGQKKHSPKPPKVVPTGLPQAYITQVQNLNQDERSGAMINIYV